MNIRQLIEPLVNRLIEEGSIDADQLATLESIEFSELRIDELILSLDNVEAYETIEMIFNNVPEILIKKVRKDVVKSFENGEIIWDLIFSSFFPLKQRAKFVFKVNVTIDELTDVDQMLSVYDNIYCIRTEVNEIKSGLCLGTKHFVIASNEVTLLAFAKKQGHNLPWIEKGSYADLQYDDTSQFTNLMRRTAQDLLANYMATH